MSNAAATRDAFMPRRPRGLGMGFVLAVLAHVLLILALAFGVNWHSRQVQGIEAELWAAVPQIAAPRQVAPEPAPVVKPRAPEPPPKPVAKPEPPPPDPQIAIEQAKKEQALREQQAREEEQKRQKLERERQEQAQREQAQRDALEKQQRDLLDKKRQQQELAQQKAARDEQLKRMMNQAAGTGDPDRPGTAARTAGPSAGYAGRVAAYVRSFIHFDTSQVNGNPQAVVEVRTAPDGRIISRRLLQSSGSAAYDDAVLRALDSAASLPRDVNGVPPVLELTFRPRD